MTARILATEPDFVPSVLAASKVGIWERDPRRGLIHCNPTMSALYGVRAADGRRGVPLHRFREAVLLEDRHLFEGRDLLSLSHGGLMFSEYRVRGRDGRVRWVLVRGVYEAMQPGWMMTGGRGIVIDITESKSAGHAAGEAIYVSPPRKQSVDEDADHPVARLCDAALATQHALQDMRAHDDPHEALEACNKMALMLIARYLAGHAEPSE